VFGDNHNRHPFGGWSSGFKGKRGTFLVAQAFLFSIEDRNM
jgi:hypothetical protein